MILYDYVCKQCKLRFEVKRGESTTCPNGHTDTLKVYGNMAVIYKGSGFTKRVAVPPTSGTLRDIKKGDK